MRHRRPILSLSFKLSDDSDAELGDLVEDPDAEAPYEVAAAALEREALRAQLARLNERERAVLTLRFGLDADGPRTLAAGGRQLRPHPRADPPDRGEGAGEAAPPERGPAVEQTGAPWLGHAAAGSPALRRAATRRDRAAPAVSCCSGGRSSAANHRHSAISGDTRRHRVRVGAVGRPGGEHDVDPPALRVDDDGRLPHQLDAQADLLARFAAHGVARVLAPSDKAAGHAPAPAVGVAHEQPRAVVPLDQADGPDVVARGDGVHRSPPSSGRETPEHLEQEPVDALDHENVLRAATSSASSSAVARGHRRAPGGVVAHDELAAAGVDDERRRPPGTRAGRRGSPTRRGRRGCSRRSRRAHLRPRRTGRGRPRRSARYWPQPSDCGG